MKTGANLLKFGEALKQKMAKVVADLPMGVGVHLVADQPVVVEHAVSGFTEALFEAVVIVLVISFVSLGLRAGLVVAIAIPACARNHLRGDGGRPEFLFSAYRWAP